MDRAAERTAPDEVCPLKVLFLHLTGSDLKPPDSIDKMVILPHRT